MIPLENLLHSILAKFEMFDGEINIDHKQIPKIFLTDDENYHGSRHIKRILGI